MGFHKPEDVGKKAVIVDDCGPFACGFALAALNGSALPSQGDIKDIRLQMFLAIVNTGKLQIERASQQNGEMGNDIDEP